MRSNNALDLTKSHCVLARTTQEDATYLLPGIQPLGCVAPAVRAAASHSLAEAVKVRRAFKDVLPWSVFAIAVCVWLIVHCY